jgi:amino-acid N-acetyltransferase
MTVRDAKISDVSAIYGLVTFYAEQDRMLFRSMANIYENLQTFKVAETDGRVVGCCALQVIWSDLAEIKSLAVDEHFEGKGIGRALVTAAIQQARQLGAGKIFAFTLQPGFFESMGFRRIDSNLLPMKVWSDCAACPKQERCDEIAVMLEIDFAS